MAQIKYVENEKETKKNKKCVYLKDVYAVKILRDERNRDYLLKLVCAALGADQNEMTKDFEVVDIRLGLSNENTHSEADVVFKNREGFYNIEVNFTYNNSVEAKNLSYTCELILRQLRSGDKKAYRNIKLVIQINFDSYDQFDDGKFIYTSKFKEVTSNKVRSELLKIVDINLDFLAKLEYTDIKKFDSDSLEWLSYVFVCNNKTILDKMYVGDLIMEKIKS